MQRFYREYYKLLPRDVAQVAVTYIMSKWQRFFLNFWGPFTVSNKKIKSMIIEWVGYALAPSLLLAVGAMVRAKERKIGEICSEVIIDKSSNKMTMESIVEAQHIMKKVHEYVKTTNIVILRLWSIILARSPKEIHLCGSGGEGATPAALTEEAMLPFCLFPALTMVVQRVRHVVIFL
ncbi:hypothetical protein VPH35_051684 [Triticum aestivum]